MIRFHFTNSFTLKNKRKIKNWLKDTVVNEKKKVGDINYVFCSKDSIIFNVDFNNELKRVMVHGLLHLLKYNDRSNQEQKIMREKENFYIKLNS